MDNKLDTKGTNTCGCQTLENLSAIVWIATCTSKIIKIDLEGIAPN